LPDAAHFGMDVQYLNFPGYNRMGLQNEITIICGDKYGNFATPGTPVYFTTDGGSIDGSGLLDERGTTTAVLVSNNPKPTHPEYGPGFATIKAQTADENNSTIEVETVILFSGYPVIDLSSILSMNVDPQSLSLYDFVYTVSDQNGNPLAPGTTIQVNIVGSGLSLTGDTDITLSDTQKRGAGSTEFRFNVTDTNVEPLSTPVLLTFITNGPNGSSQESIKFEPGSTPSTTTLPGPASLTVVSISNDAIYVAGSGSVENTEIIFVVQDSLGNPLRTTNTVEVQFAIGAGPGGGEYIFPETGITNASGQINTNLQSGIKAGIVQIVALIDHDGKTIRSKPVSVAIHGGLPDAAHFGVAPEFLNFAGFNRIGEKMEITAIIGDKYGNIVAPGTAIYFTTDGGSIEGSALTDDLGFAKVTLVSNNPCPIHPTLGPGFATVTAQTADENQNIIEAQTIVLFSGVSEIFVSPTNVSVPNGGSQSFTYSVQDQNGNPLAPGTKITVSVTGEGVTALGDVSVTMPDTQSRGYGSTDFAFTLADSDAETIALKSVIVNISVDGPNGSAMIQIGGSGSK